MDAVDTMFTGENASFDDVLYTVAIKRALFTDVERHVGPVVEHQRCQVQNLVEGPRTQKCTTGGGGA